MTSRELFLQRVRNAVAQGNRAGEAPAIPPRGGAGYQGAGADPVEQFCEQFAAAGGFVLRPADRDEAATMILNLVEKAGARTVLLGRGQHLDALDLAARLRVAGVEVLHADQHTLADRDRCFEAEVGISAVDYLIAETGTIVVTSKPDNPRATSLLPPVHIAVAARGQIVPDLFDVFEAVQAKGLNVLPSNLTLITGPSKTGDIELKLVTGVHGPGEVYVVLMG